MVTQTDTAIDVNSGDWMPSSRQMRPDGASRIGQPLRPAAETVNGARILPPDQVDVRSIRRRLGLTQERFAARFGFSARTVQQWEQGRRRPEGAARLLLKLIDRAPEAVCRVLAD